MNEKRILDFLRSLCEHKDEGERYLKAILLLEMTKDEPRVAPVASEPETVESDIDSMEECVGATIGNSEDGNTESLDKDANLSGSAGKAASDNKEEVKNDPEEDKGNRRGSLPSEFAAHLSDSMKCLEGFISGRRPSADDWNAVFAILFSIVSDAADGVISTATAETLLRAVSFERAVGIALHEGEVKGRNAQIEEKILSPAKNDGVPSLQGAGRGYTPCRSKSIFDLAGEAR